MNYVEIHIGDYSAATFHLTPLEDGIYWRLLRCYYRDERPLPADLATVERMAGARTDEERDAVAVVLREFFSLCDDGYRQSRCDAEIAHYLRKSQKASESASARWAGRRGRNANAMPSHSEGNAPQSPSTNNQEHPPTPRKRGADAGRFDEFWQAWPKNERKQDKAKCLDHWKRNQLDEHADAILADVRTKRGTRKWAEGFVEAPLVYLRGKRWLDGVQPDTGTTAEAVDWRATWRSISAKGVEVGVGEWSEDLFVAGKVPAFPIYRAKVEAAVAALESGKPDPAGMAKVAELVGGITRKVA